MNGAYHIEIRKYHTFITRQQYINMGNNPKIIFSSVIAKELIFGTRPMTSLYICVITIFSGVISQISDANKKISYPNKF